LPFGPSSEIASASRDLRSRAQATHGYNGFAA
jgi:hypothetical protein